ncbi:hypothetical protein EYF80_022440 [Liparis tanakae]|uniref:Uncharacterized protein n=1 Tax=Liparis tanakae TaxID=230148 RepID=A0A4Z2HQR2_9TELE|nr:hypothetical protein EYF80_022440 [Liparis tanakae]
MAAGLMTWLDRVAMVPRVVMGVTREALELSTTAPARLEETVPVTVPRVVTPGRKRTPAWPMMADMGIVLIMVVPCLVVVGDTPLMLRIVGLFPAPPAWEVVMMVVGLPSAEVTSFRMVPAGREPFDWGRRARVMQTVWGKASVSGVLSALLVPPLPMVSGLLTRVMVLVTPPTTVVTTWACWATVTAPDLCTVMIGLVVVGED